MKTKKIPMRMCIGCQNMVPKRELIRIVKSKDKGIIMDPTGKQPGRGAYLCKSQKCFEIIIKGNRINRVFKEQVDEITVDKLKKYLEELNEQ